MPIVWTPIDFDAECTIGAGFAMNTGLIVAAAATCSADLAGSATTQERAMTTVAGMFETRQEAEDAVHRLQAAGFSRDTIGVAMRDVTESGALAEATGSNDLSAEGATAGLVSGAAVGALVGIALVTSTVLLPGIGTVVIGGPIAAALTGAGIGAASGGLIGGLVGAGIPEHEATEYKTRIEAGHILVTVQAGPSEVARARQILVEEGARTA